MEKKYWSVQRLAVFGVMSALVFTSSWMQIPIGDVSRVHLGNGFCALTGLLFGPWVGGLASGVGSMLFDFTNPMYIAESWITFLTKFAIGFLAGLISWGGLKQKAAAVHTMGRDIAGAVVGVLAYVALYMGKSFIVMYCIERQTLGAVQVQMLTKLASSMVNAVAGAAPGGAVCPGNVNRDKKRRLLARSLLFLRQKPGSTGSSSRAVMAKGRWSARCTSSPGSGPPSRKGEAGSWRQ